MVSTFALCLCHLGFDSYLHALYAWSLNALSVLQGVSLDSLGSPHSWVCHSEEWEWMYECVQFCPSMDWNPIQECPLHLESTGMASGFLQPCLG